MENREILIANTRTQKRYKLVTDATTLGELKVAMDNANIDYADMTFTEGITKTQLLDNATQLPKDVMFKGDTTNNLVILLTNTKKNIASGEGSRQDAYTAIKENNLGNLIKAQFGKNYTILPTDTLWEVINNYVVATPEEEEASEDIPTVEEPVIQKSSLLESIKNTLISLNEIGILSDASLGVFTDEILEYLDAKEASFREEEYRTSVSTSDGSITDDDIDAMLEDL